MQKDYFWIIAYLDGQPHLLGGGIDGQFGIETRDEAIDIATSTLETSNFKIVNYPTRNISTASAYFRGKVLRDTHDLRKATKRIKHRIRRK